MPKYGRIALGIAGAAVGVALAAPPVRRQAFRIGTRALDELAVRVDTDLTRSLVLLTSEGKRTRIPRTVLLTGVRLDEVLWVLAWSRSAGWLTNVRGNPEVVIDDRKRVQRATATIVEGEEAERVREAFLATLPGAIRTVVGADAGPLGPGLPAVKITPR